MSNVDSMATKLVMLPSIQPNLPCADVKIGVNRNAIYSNF